MSIRWKIVIIYVLLVFLVMIAFGTIIIFSIRIQEESYMQDILQEQARVINQNVIISSQNMILSGFASPINIEELFQEPFQNLIANNIQAGLEAFIIRNSDGRTIQKSVVAHPGFLEYITSPVVNSARVGYPSFSSNQLYLNENGILMPWFEYSYPIFLENGYNADFVLYIRHRADYFNHSIAQTTRIIGISIIIALLLSVFLGIIFSNTITHNILNLNKKMKDLNIISIKNNQEFEPIQVFSKDEIAELALSFNNMVFQIKENQYITENEKNKVEIIVNNMTDGILAFDKFGNISHINIVSRELLKMDDISELNIKDFFERIGIKFIDFESIEDSMIFLNSKYININFNIYENNGVIDGVIAVLQDITKHINLDNMRKDFVANVSHEIRTPLTTIKSYAETLLDGASNDKGVLRDFLNIINSEADRMTRIVKDLLDLTNLDANKMIFQFNDIDLINLLNDKVNNYKIYAKKQEKNIYFNSSIYSAIVSVDISRINQVLDNIISNSFRYSEKGAIISINLLDSENHYIVRIKDNGIGIPKEDLHNIFERFYRVDKARSKDLGGTGLGLSIAKEIMEGHGGRIYAASEIGEGTTMTLRFPK